MSDPRYLTAVLVGAVASTTLLAVPASASTASSMRAAVIRLTNVERAKVGCPPLRSSTALNRAAQRHSSDMAEHDFIEHTGSNGSTLTHRAEAAGYTGWKTLAENVVGGPETAAEAVDSWMDSPGHRANILNCSLKHVGVGYVKTSGIYWTQDFGDLN
ncbi:CAP domain-containing protein [Streptomyces sp. NPDC088116]|uniref:CAP domain-containing protein n=1 Tax=Streptomyces sp. NPDC088116 TaxID=3365825 RepID=UPI0037F65E40